jgi:REP element-mobilizing transposase RayT
MNRGRRSENIFTEKNNYYIFIDLLKELVEDYNIKIAAYCLLPNHYHLLVQTPDSNISRAMRHLNGVYTQRYNRSHNCDGTLFRGRYKSILVDGDSYLMELVRYIHRNPLEAGLVDHLDNYSWSSHKGYLSGAKKWDWLNKNYILNLFANKRADAARIYRQFVLKETNEEINKIFGRGKLPAIIGNDTFIDKIKNSFFSSKRHEEIPETRFLAPDASKIIKEVCNFYDISEHEIFSSRRGHFNEPRNVSIYLTRRLRGDTLKEVGEFFGINRNSTISSVVERLKIEIVRNKKLKNRIENLRQKLIKSQA